MIGGTRKVSMRRMRHFSLPYMSSFCASDKGENRLSGRTDNASSVKAQNVTSVKPENLSNNRNNKKIPGPYRRIHNCEYFEDGNNNSGLSLGRKDFTSPVETANNKFTAERNQSQSKGHGSTKGQGEKCDQGNVSAHRQTERQGNFNNVFQCTRRGVIRQTGLFRDDNISHHSQALRMLNPKDRKHCVTEKTLITGDRSKKILRKLVASYGVVNTKRYQRHQNRRKVIFHRLGGIGSWRKLPSREINRPVISTRHLDNKFHRIFVKHYLRFRSNHALSATCIVQRQSPKLKLLGLPFSQSKPVNSRNFLIPRDKTNKHDDHDPLKHSQMTSPPSLSKTTTNRHSVEPRIFTVPTSRKSRQRRHFPTSHLSCESTGHEHFATVLSTARSDDTEATVSSLCLESIQSESGGTLQAAPSPFRLDSSQNDDRTFSGADNSEVFWNDRNVNANETGIGDTEQFKEKKRMAMPR